MLLSQDYDRILESGGAIVSENTLGRIPNKCSFLQEITSLQAYPGEFWLLKELRIVAV